MGTPLELVRYNAQTSKFEIGDEALATLRKVKSPVGVVAVCGRARQGKSFVLNQLLHQSSGGFTVGPTHRPCTKGLWMWSTPQKRVAPDGSEQYMVLLDTEGIDAYDQTAQYSTQIFSLAVLLSSLFIYNQMGGIDESALDRLSLVTEMAKHIRVRAGEDNSRLGEYSPIFLWLLRDFYLKLEEDGRKITAKDYLETALQPVSGSGPAVEAKNGIRASIKAIFPDRDCATLVRPMFDEAQLAQLDRVAPEKLRPEFRQGVEQLIQYIFARTRPKQFNGQYMTGPVLAGLVELYVKAINEGAVPTIATAWQGVAEAESRRAAEEAEAMYARSFNQGVAAEEAALDAEHQRCIELATALFKDVAVGDERIRDAHQRKLLQAVAQRFGEVRARKLAEAASAVNEMLYKANMTLGAAARSGMNLDELQAQVAKFVTQYGQQARGPTKWQRLAEFVLDLYPSLAADVLRREEQKMQEQLESARRETESARREAEEARREAAGLRKQLEQAERAGAEAARQAQDTGRQAQALQQQLADARVAAEQRGARVAALEGQLKEAFAAHEAKVASASEFAEAKVRSAQAEFMAKMAEMQAQLSAERTRAADLSADVAALQARLKSAESQAAGLMGEGDQWRAKLNSTVQERLAMMAERDKARDEALALQVQLECAVAEGRSSQAQLARLREEVEAEAQQRVEMQARLDALIQEAQAARSQALAQARAPTLNASLPRGGRDEGHLPDQHGAEQGSAGPGGLSEREMAKMTVNQIRDWLTSNGAEEAVWALSNRQPAPKKADWLELMRSRQQQGASA